MPGIGPESVTVDKDGILACWAPGKNPQLLSTMCSNTENINSECVPRALSGSLPALGQGLEGEPGISGGAHMSTCLLCCVLMLIVSFRGSRLTKTILVKVSLCDSMKSIKQTFNFVDIYELRK